MGKGRNAPRAEEGLEDEEDEKRDEVKRRRVAGHGVGLDSLDRFCPHPGIVSAGLSFSKKACVSHEALSG